jgi:hypothetical protein
MLIIWNGQQGWVASFVPMMLITVQLASSGFQHMGIVIGKQYKHTIGDWVSFLELVHGVYEAEEMRNLVEYVK